MNAGETEKLENRINMYQNELVFRLLACLDAKTDNYASVQANKLQTLSQNDAKILEVTAFNQNSILAKISGEAPTKRTNETTRAERAERRHVDVIGAILTMDNGETKLITSKEAALQTGSNRVPDFERQAQNLMRMQASSDGETAQVSFLEKFKPYRHVILNCLTFRHIKDRFDIVKDPHEETFRWIFREPDQTGRPWSSFPNWLEQGEGCYWINGKAGSGKSTLMKFLYQDPRTRSSLRRWAGKGRLVLASFFFWYLGPLANQKSQSGLLRSLLFDVLEQNPSLIPVVMPELCLEAAKLDERVRLDDPTLPELTRWFKRLAQNSSRQLCICFMIDGIDEYDGRYQDLIDLVLTTASMTPFIKFIVSSRPIVDCTDAFSRFPGIRLQDLTGCDIQQFASDQLEKRVREAYDIDPTSLIDDLAIKSCGVFLWVVLVAASLVDGIKSGDTLAELRQRVSELPADLADLFRVMMSKIPTNYRQQASEMFQIVLKSQEYESHFGHPLMALQLSFAERDWKYAQETQIKPITLMEENKKCDEINRRIRSRCCGLLELNNRVIATRDMGDVDQPNVRSQPEKMRRLCVEFVHKTVVEFLSDRSNWSIFGMEAKRLEFSPSSSLFRSYLLTGKTTLSCETIGRNGFDGFLIGEAVKGGLIYAHDCEESNLPIPPAYFDELDKVIGHHWKKAQSYQYSKNGRRIISDTREHWSRMLWSLFPELSGRQNLFFSISQLGFPGISLVMPFPTYIRTLLSHSDPGSDKVGPSKLLNVWVQMKFSSRVWETCQVKGHVSSPLKSNVRQDGGILLYSILDHLREPIQAPLNVTLVEHLLASGADPNYSEKNGSNTTWTVLLLSLPLFLPSSGAAHVHELDEMIKEFIHHNASMDALVHVNIEDTWLRDLGEARYDYYKCLGHSSGGKCNALHFIELLTQNTVLGRTVDLMGLIKRSAPGILPWADSCMSSNDGRLNSSRSVTASNSSNRHSRLGGAVGRQSSSAGLGQLYNKIGNYFSFNNY
jgi:NACHT domain